MTPFIGELIGTALLILLGDGVVANVVLKDTKGGNSGWIVITMGWAMAVFVGVFVAAGVSGAHLNPAVTLALAMAGKFAWAQAPAYITAQMLGAALGALLVWAQYKSHFERTENRELKLAVFCTAPQIRNTLSNLLSEILGTFVLVFGVLFMASPDVGLGAMSALPVALLVFAIGLSLGGTTGYAINPARDLAPRLVHQFVPLPNKSDGNWGYAWIAVAGPIVGAIAAATAYLALK